MNKKQVFAFLLAIFAVNAFAADPLVLPAIDVTATLSAVATWAIALAGSIFLGKMSIPLAMWGFNKVSGFLNR